MAGVGEAGAIVGLISTAASLSKAVIDVASKYKIARLQIESFGQEVGILGSILGQLHCLYKKGDLLSDEGAIFLTADILDQCSGLFAELETYRNALYSKTGSVRNITFLGKTKWVVEEKELEYLRTRVESMKINMLLMMTMQCVHGLQRSNVRGSVENYAEQARILSIQSQDCAKRLQTLENDVAIPTSTNANPVINRTSIDTIASARSIIDSILSLYGHEPLYGTPSESKGEILGTGTMQVDQARVSRIINDYIRERAVVDLGGPDSPLMSPRTSQYSLDSSTARNDEAVGKLEVDYLDHLAATAHAISTDFCEYNSDQHQYDSERIVSGFLLRDTRGVTLKEFYVQVASFPPKGKGWRYYEFPITLPRRVRPSRPDERPMTILDSLVRQLPLHDAYMLRARYLHPEKRAMMTLDYLLRQVSLPEASGLRQIGVLVEWEYVDYMLNTRTYTYLINRQQSYPMVLALMLRAVDDRLKPVSYELCLSSYIRESTSCLRMDQKPLALYQEWLQEWRRPFFLIRLKDVVRT